MASKETTNLPGPETKEEAESLIPKFELARILNQDQNGRRITLFGSISEQPAILVLERAAFPSSETQIKDLLTKLKPTNLGANDIYRWYMATVFDHSLAPELIILGGPSPDPPSPNPDLKLNLIHPSTPSHLRKYSSQRLRHVTETSDLYHTHIHPYIASQRTSGRLDWIYNILSGHTEQEDVILRSSWSSPSSSQTPQNLESGFLLLPDLNWDRKTITSLHLLALVQRRDIFSLRDLRKKHIPFLKSLLSEVLTATAAHYAGEVDEDELKCYVHYHPTYYHFHVHVVHIMLEPEGGTQSVGKAWLLSGLIAWLESMAGDDETGFEGVNISYGVGEESELWKRLWGPLKEGTEITLNKGLEKEN